MPRPAKREDRRLGRAGKSIALALLFFAACAAPSTEERARQAAEEIKKGVVDPGEAALDQNLERPLVRRVQEALSERREYMGEVDGRIDAVLVNAIQAFQRSVNDEIPWWRPWDRISEDGMVDAKTRALLLGEPAES